MDFYDIIIDNTKKTISIGPVFRTIGIRDIIIDNKAQEVIAYWDEKKSRWSDDISKLLTNIDTEIFEHYKEFQKLHPEEPVTLNTINNVASPAYRDWLKFLTSVRTPKPDFNSEVLFSDHEIEREDYATYKLPYRPDPSVNIDAFLDGMSVFYDHENLDKLMWFIGATLTGQIHSIQKFAYLYGKAGSGKGTTIEIVKQIFQGPYTGQISLEKLTGKSEFASGQVRDVPVLFDPEVNLYRMTNDTPLLALTAHEPISVNRKFRDPVEITFRGFLIAASNQPVKVRNIDAGINRRLVDINQTGNKMTSEQYVAWLNTIASQIPGIAAYAIERFTTLGRSYFDGYVSQQMLEQTNYLHRFVRENYMMLTDPMPLGKAYELYQTYLSNDNVDFKVTRHDFQHDFARYYDHTESKHQTINGVQSKFWFVGFDRTLVVDQQQAQQPPLPLNPTISSEFTSDYNYFENTDVTFPAQLAKPDGTPRTRWSDVTTTNHDIDQHQQHYIQAPASLLVIDIDNHHPDTDRPVLDILSELSLPSTYSEPSRSGQGIHLYYTYNDDIPLKSVTINSQIEIKVYNGAAAIRRKFTTSNGVQNLAQINHLTLKPLFDRLPKENQEIMIDDNFKKSIESEKQLRELIKKALRREVHANTKPNIDFIAHILNEAVEQNITYNIVDMEASIEAFAMGSTNQSTEAIKIATNLPYKNPAVDPTPYELPKIPQAKPADIDLLFFDWEVFRNVNMFSYWKRSTMDKPATLINPTPEQLFSILDNEYPVAFNNYRYDDYITYYALLGYSPMELFNVSRQLIVDKSSQGLSFKAHETAYLDIYEMCVTKQSLKRWEVELHLPYMELETDWDKPLPESEWEHTAQYNRNDVNALPAVFEANYSEYEALEILSALSGLPINRTVNTHTTQIIFTKPDGTHVKPDAELTHYTDLSTIFPGYSYSKYKPTVYMGLEPSRGGYVYSQPGVYERVVELDITSMHPTSSVELDYFGSFTANYAALLEVKVLLGNDDIPGAIKAMPVLEPILNDPHTNIKALIKAVKRALNSAYGLTSATFDNPLKNPKNVDNIVAARGALFMITLQRKLESEGIGVVHIKTDSIKLNNPTEENIDEVKAFAKTYGYTFKIEDTYTPFVIIDKAQLIGYSAKHESWHAIGTKFINPYVYKTLFSHEDYEMDDYSRIIQSRVGSIYLGDQFIGRIGNFVASPNGEVITVHKPDGSTASPAGTLSDVKVKSKNPETGRTVTTKKPYKFLLLDEAVKTSKDAPDIDFSFYDSFVSDVLHDIMHVGGLEGFRIIFPDTADKLISMYELVKPDITTDPDLLEEAS